ncbi:NTF2-like protein [Xylariaceae sp. FL0662B]|nr:NTF2-like protein [Xylariaceae sp. FL0662B]
MAPSGPRKGAAAFGTRSSRASATNGRNTTTKGGVTKRRSNGPARVDRDGDLDMSVPVAANGSSRNAKRANNRASPPGPAPGPASRSTRSGGAGARPPKPTAKAQQIIQRVISGGSGSLSSRISNGVASGSRDRHGAQHSNYAQSVTLKVEGLKSSRAAANEGGGLKELLTFLERKAQAVGKTTRTIRIKKSQLKGDFVYITASKMDGEEIVKLNNFSWAGAVLKITEASQDSMSSDALEIKDRLRQILSSRYDADAKLLNLSTLGEDPVLNQMGFFSGVSTPEKLFRALMAVCEGLFKTPLEKRNAVVSISLAGNNIDDVLQIMSLSDTFPDLVNLDLSQNQFKDLKDLQRWRYRLRNIQTLLLNNNPIETMNPNYRAEMMTWFPKLQNLSGIQVRTPEQIAAEEAASRPTPIPQNGPDFRDINGVGEGFIREFMRMYDTDRHSLAAKYYDEQSSFSYAVNVHSPHPADIQPPTWGAYIRLSRNHVKITTTPARQQRLFTGTNLIQSAWKQLPPTRHPDLATQFDKYIIDCHPVHGLADPTGQSPMGVDGIIITLHGEFEDQEPGTVNTTKRGFSRTFVLGPGAPGRNPIRVISDMLSLKMFTPLPTLVPAAAAQSNEEIQKQMVIEICKRTGMVPEYSKFCLEGANWNFDQALVSFNEKRAQLPAEAFATASV